jgi:hypothetical protein
VAPSSTALKILHIASLVVVDWILLAAHKLNRQLQANTFLHLPQVILHFKVTKSVNRAQKKGRGLDPFPSPSLMV